MNDGSVFRSPQGVGTWDIVAPVPWNPRLLLMNPEETPTLFVVSTPNYPNNSGSGAALMTEFPCTLCLEDEEYTRPSSILFCSERGSVLLSLRGQPFVEYFLANSTAITRGGIVSSRADASFHEESLDSFKGVTQEHFFLN